MSDHTNHPDHAPLPPELVGIARGLDRLAASEQAAAGAAFEQRLAALTSPAALDGAHVDTLAHADRGAAPSTLEDRIFQATRSMLKPAPAPIPIHIMRTRWAARIAASLLIAGAGLIAYVASRPVDDPTATQKPAGASAEALAASLEDDFAAFGRILNVAMGESETTTAASSATGLDSLATGDTTEFELPRFDFLKNDMEGSL